MVTWVLPSGAQVGQRPVLAHLGELLASVCAILIGSGNSSGGVVAGVAEHQALVARALLVELVGRAAEADVLGGVDALRDVRRLRTDRDLDAAGVAVEALVGGVVADLEDLLAHELGDRGVGLGGHLAGNDDQPGGQQRLDGHTALRVVLEQVVEHGVADLVGDLVRVTLGHGLRREQTSGHSGENS